MTFIAHHSDSEPDKFTDASWTVPESTFRVVIADDEAINRLALRLALEELEGLEVVAEAFDGLQAVEYAKTLQPDLVIIDLTMPEMDGISATEQIRKNDPSVAILILSSVTRASDIERALLAGANGYCLKESMSTKLTGVLNVLRHGRSFWEGRD